MINKIFFFTNYIGSYLLYIVSALMCLNGNIDLGNMILECALIIRIVSIICLIIRKDEYENINFHTQYLVVELLIGIFYFSALFSKVTDKNYLIIIWTEGICIILSLVYEILTLLETIKQNFSIKIIHNKFTIYNSLTCFIFALLAIPCIKNSYMWDSEVYVRGIVESAENYNFTFERILNAIQTHLQLGFDFIYIIVYNIMGNNASLIIIGNIFLACITIIVFGNIIKILLPTISEIEYFFSIIIFAFSPLFLGIIGSVNLDFTMLCFFIWFVYCHMKKHYILQLFFGILLCFSKEPGVILGASYIGAHICGESFIRIKKLLNQQNVMKLFFMKLPIKRYLLDIFPFLLFVVVFLQNDSRWTRASNKSEEYVMNAFGYIGNGYILEKLKAIFILNYSWVIWTFIIILIIFIKYKRVSLYNYSHLIYVGVSFIAYTIFNFCYITYLHPRYISCAIFMSSLLLAYLIGCAFKHTIYKNSMLLIVATLLFIQNFFNSDIITKSVYDSVPIGKGELISTRGFDSYLYSDANIYNRQFTYWQFSLLKFLDEINYNENDLLVFPDIQYGIKKEMSSKHSRYSILGIWKEESNIFFNPQEKILENFYTEGAQKLNAFFYNQDCENFNFTNYERVFFIDIGILDDKKKMTENFLNKYQYLSKKNYNTLSWKIEIYQIK